MSAPRPELATGSARRVELLDAAYAYIVANGAADLSLRPLATAIGSSPRVLLYLFGSKDGLIQALLQHARADQLESMTQRVVEKHPAAEGVFAVARAVWEWLSTPSQRPLLALWVEAYGRSLTDPDGPWSPFAQGTVDDWLTMLADAQPIGVRHTSTAESEPALFLGPMSGMFDPPQWLRDLSPFTHSPLVPVQPMNWAPVVVMLVLAGGGLIGATLRFRLRQIG